MKVNFVNVLKNAALLTVIVLISSACSNIEKPVANTASDKNIEMRNALYYNVPDYMFVYVLDTYYNTRDVDGNILRPGMYVLDNSDNIRSLHKDTLYLDVLTKKANNLGGDINWRLTSINIDADTIKAIIGLSTIDFDVLVSREIRFNKN